MTEKVYCKECDFFIPIRHPLPAECRHPDNFKSNWYSKQATTIYHPSRKNKDNNCPWYQKKNIEIAKPSIKNKKRTKNEKI